MIKCDTIMEMVSHGNVALVFAGEQNVTARPNLKARDHLRPADDTRSARLEVYAFINMDTRAVWSTIQITVCVLCHSVPQKVQSHTLPRPKGKTSRVALSSPSTGGSKGTGMYVLSNSGSTLCSRFPR